VGLLGITFAVLNDPRGRFRGEDAEPPLAPPDAVVAPRWRQALAATMPSTVGVSILAAIALAPQPALAALLGGVSAGLGVAALISVWSVDPSLHVDPKSSIVTAGSPACASYGRNVPRPAGRRGRSRATGTTLRPCRTGC
jgi:hypothetical protein